MLLRAPGFGGGFNQGVAILTLAPWGERRPSEEIQQDINRRLSDLPGVRAFAAVRGGLASGGGGRPVQVVLGGPSYEVLDEWRKTLTDSLEEDNPGIADVDWDYKRTQPQVRVVVDYARASDLGVTVADIGATLQTMLGSRRVTTFVERGEEYDVVLEGLRNEQTSANDVSNIFVRSARTRELIPLSSVVTLEDTADSRSLERYNRVRAITISANLADGASLGTVLEAIEDRARRLLPSDVQIDYKGPSLDYKRSGSSILFVFAIGLLIVFLVLAAQFESWVHPIIIMLAVPTTLAGGIFGLWATGTSLNIYTQVALVMLVGLAAKNGILIVEFANQLRDEGKAFAVALREAALTRLRPILMTGLTTLAGAVPLVLSFGAGAETRQVIGVVILYGVAASILVTLIVIPAAYSVLARRSGSPGDVARRLEAEASAMPEAKAQPSPAE
jgi:multidrug efflux pump